MKPNDEQLETRSRRRWLGVVTTFFILQAMLWAAALTLVSDDPSHAVVSSYGSRALDWDTQRQEEARSAALGWEVKIRVDALPSHQRRGMVHVELEDPRTGPVDADRVALTMFHHASAAHRQELALQAESAGRYQGVAQVDRAGRWRFELRATRGDDEFVLARSQMVELD